MSKSCSIEGCTNPYRSNGWCAKHWYRWRYHGDPHSARPYRRNTSSQCLIEDCVSPPYARGWCLKHYRRWQYHGDPLGHYTSVGISPRLVELLQREPSVKSVREIATALNVSRQRASQMLDLEVTNAMRRGEHSPDRPYGSINNRLDALRLKIRAEKMEALLSA